MYFHPFRPAWNMTTFAMRNDLGAVHKGRPPLSRIHCYAANFRALVSRICRTAGFSWRQKRTSFMDGALWKTLKTNYEEHHLFAFSVFRKLSSAPFSWSLRVARRGPTSWRPSGSWASEEGPSLWTSKRRSIGWSWAPMEIRISTPMLRTFKQFSAISLSRW